MRKIPNIKDKKHFLNSLPELFETLTLPELASIANSLGLADIINDGTIVPMYSLDVYTDTERFLNFSIDYTDIRLLASAFNYLSDISGTILSYTWRRKFSNETEYDPNWVRTGREIFISKEDLPDSPDVDVSFVCRAVIDDNHEIEDSTTFSYSYSLSKVRIVPTVTTFVGATPTTNTLRLEMSGFLPLEYRWYLGGLFVGTANEYVLQNSAVQASGSVTIRVEVVDTQQNVHYDFITIGKIVNGQNGQQGPIGPQGNPGQDGQDGSPGVPGTDAPILRMLEWVNGRSYFNNFQYKDYVYYRPRDKWYILNQGIESQVASGDPATQTSVWIETTEVQGSILAENANIGGWIMRNNKLLSQAGLVSDTNGVPLYSNIILDGVSGAVTLGNNRGILNESGLTFKDSSQRPRIVMSWDDGSGIPILRFLNPDGSIKWEAGQNGYVVITEGTQQPSWGENTGFRRISSLTGDNTLVFTTAINTQVKNFMSSYINREPNQTGPSSGGVLSDQTPYFTTNAMPSSTVYSASNTYGYANWYNRGDMVVNEGKHQGFYIVQTPVEASALPSTNLIPDGWYMQDFVSGGNGGMIRSTPVSETTTDFFVPLVYLKNGVSVRTQNVVIHTRTVI